MNNMDFETQIRSIVQRMEYPPTPDIAGPVIARMRPAHFRLSYRTLTRSLVLGSILLLSLMLIPPVRAAVLEFIQIGVVQIFRTEPASTPAPMQLPSLAVPFTATPALTQAASIPPTTTPADLLPLLEQMAGETTLTEAQKKATYSLLLPTYPATLGLPDRVFVQDANGPLTILVWMDPEQPDRVKMDLHFIPEGSWTVNKFAPQTIDETSVNGHPAVWAVGPYPILFRNGDMEISGLVNGHVLIWVDGGVTYRLESDLPMQEAVRVAESLAPVP